MFYINRMGCSCKHDGSFVLNRPRGYEGYLMLFVKTKAVFEIEGETYNIEPNTFLIYNKNSPQLYRACENEYINDWIQFECSEDISHTSSALSREREVPKTESTRSTFRKKDAITSERSVFPFCLDTRMRTVRKRKRHWPPSLPTISSIWMRAHFCQG